MLIAEMKMVTYAFRHPVAIDKNARRCTREALRAWRVDSQSFVDDCLQIRELLRCGSVDGFVGIKVIPDFFAKSSITFLFFE